MTRKLHLATFAAALLLVFTLGTPRQARADSIGPNCSACDGNIYTLTYYQTASQIGSNTIHLLIDASGYDYTPAYLMAVAPNVDGWMNPVLLSAPGGGVSNWQMQAGGLAASGCNGHGSPFFCYDTTTQASFNITGNSTPLEFLWTLQDNNLPTTYDGTALKVQFENASGDKVGSLLSTDMTLTPETPSSVPEPASLALLGTGLLGLGWLGRRKFDAPPSDPNC